MSTHTFDERGWASSLVDVAEPDDAVALFLPTSPVRIHSFELVTAARALGFSLTVEPEKHYPSGTIPLADIATLSLSAEGARDDREPVHRARVRVVPSERAQRVVLAGMDTAMRAGGQGMDGLVKRCRLVVQIDEATSDASALLVAALFARAHLGPIRLPDRAGEPAQVGLFGIKGARERLERAGINVAG